MKKPNKQQWAMVLSVDRLLHDWAYLSTPFAYQQNPDAIQESYDILLHKAIKASMSWKKSKNVKFSTYIGKHMRKVLYRHWELKTFRKSENPFSLNNLLGEDSVLFESLGYEEKRSIEFDEVETLHEALATLSARQRQVVTEWAGLGCQQRAIPDIAKDLRVSVENTRLIKLKAFKKIKKYFRMKGIE